jgi:magnesium-transporting ATPase (P-type)
MDQRESMQTPGNKKPAWVKYALIILIFEKIIQHIVVTIAFYFNWKDIGSTVAVNPKSLMLIGAGLAILFMFSLWGMLARKKWAINLVILLGLSDVIGEFVAQGKIAIVITVSFVVATALLILSLLFRRQEREHTYHPRRMGR